MKKMIVSLVLLGMAVGGCRSMSPDYVPVASTLSRGDLEYAVGQAVQSVLAQDRIKVATEGATAVFSVMDVELDTNDRGRNAEPLVEELTMLLREELTNSGKAVVKNRRIGMGGYAEQNIKVDYILLSKLMVRDVPAVSGKVAKSYTLNLTLVDARSGLEFWQKRVAIKDLNASRANSL